MAWPPDDVKEARSPFYELLRLISRRPGMYLGEQPFGALPGFIEGYRAALAIHDKSDSVLDAMQDGDMNAFFAGQLDLPMKYSGENAFKMLRYVSPSDEGAWEGFFTHFDEFLKAKNVSLPSPSISDEWRARKLGKSTDV